MSVKTRSEIVFESFCRHNGIQCAPIPRSERQTPDYQVTLGAMVVYVEIKQIESDEEFDRSSAIQRSVGARIRAQIKSARPQLRAAATLFPAVLIIYNNLDPLQLLGTEPHDFLSGMYGDMTLYLQRGNIVDSGYGANAALRENRNTTFSAVGNLRQTKTGASITLYENAFARSPLDFEAIPGCIEVVRIKVS